MKFNFVICLPVLAIVLSACASNSPSTETTPNPQVPPTEYPNPPSYPNPSSTPNPPSYPNPASPVQINAPVIETPALVAVDMLDELEGWGVTEAQIARTNDGGLTWYNVTPPDVAETGSSVDTFFLDLNHAWVQKPDFEKFPNSGILYRTSDGGLTWTKSDVPFSRGDLNFIDAENGWMLADLGVGAGSNAVAVYQTTDGGASWEQTYSNDPNDPNAADSLPLGGIKSDLVPLDMKTAWVSGVIYAPGEAYLYRTGDGGHTWTQVPLTLPQGMENNEVSIDRDQMKFVSTKDGFLALRMAGDSTQTAVYVTTDAGKTWAVPSMPLEGAGASVFLSPQEAVIYNGELFYVTQDAARTWVTVTPNVAFGESFAGMDFVNTSLGWVITFDGTHRSLYRTMDGGATWSVVIP